MENFDRNLVRNIADFPIKGITFKDITPLIADGPNFSKVIDLLSDISKNSHYIAGVESRGFIFAAAVAQATGKGFIPIRKAGKLPGKVISQSFDLEYGSASLEIHQDIYEAGKSVTIIDDVLATGGTAIAAINLVKKIGLKIDSVSFLLEISQLEGKSRILATYPDLQINLLLAE